MIRWEVFLLRGNIPKIDRCRPSRPSTFWSCWASHPSAETETSIYDEGTPPCYQGQSIVPNSSKTQWPCVAGDTAKTKSVQRPSLSKACLLIPTSQNHIMLKSSTMQYPQGNRYDRCRYGWHDLIEDALSWRGGWTCPQHE